MNNFDINAELLDINGNLIATFSRASSFSGFLNAGSYYIKASSTILGSYSISTQFF